MDWRSRVKNPTFWLGLVGAVASPVLAYLGIGWADLTTWQSVGDAVMATVGNPYLVGCVVLAVLSVLGVVTDPTTPGVTDKAKDDSGEADE